MTEEKNLHPGKPPNWQRDQPRQRGNLKALEKSKAARLRRAKLRESCMDHRITAHRHHSLRHLGGSWALILRLRKSVLHRGLGLTVWRQPEGLGSGAPQVGEWSTTVEEAQEEV